MVNVLFVCLGNICRSPTAEGVFRALIEREGLAGKVGVDSAGTGAWHIGNPPDRRAQAAARGRGVDISAQRARQVELADFDAFDYVIAMDRSNHADLTSLAPPAARDRIHMFLAFAPETGLREVPDPYYGGAGGFDEVLDLVEAASRGLLDDIRNRHL
ncbi:MAG: low molecular weight phosphotyrosine protein phosphatase [Magnetovibrio sp.]|nr:low molecular weight phosphotyrosine protein phosphatase [Magnetovibrio sp.]